MTEQIPSAAWDPFLDIASGDPWQLRTSEKCVSTDQPHHPRRLHAHLCCLQGGERGWGPKLQSLVPKGLPNLSHLQTKLGPSCVHSLGGLLSMSRDV